ncbi:uncharacterized protein LOC116921224 [Daphnia magna]|uniref:uncharacterized protein LOC116921224 n=1 Tax=Daphnia magna TaxID=35525 RepID=UPI001E1BC2A7|nr:uncharacterized protein LOC116921224 [Daphnia magna]
MSSVGSIVLLVTVLVLSCPIYATGRDQLLAREKKISSSFNVYHDQQESLLTRRIRQSSGIPTSNHTLTCHQCRSFEDGDQCIHLPTNSSIFNEPCGSHQTACMVKRFSYTENATSPLALWYIERNCSSKCEPGCLILGERTKLYACISCCNHNLCNIGNGANYQRFSHDLAVVQMIVLIFLNFYLVAQ